MRGQVDDVTLLYDLGQSLANSTHWPGWDAGSAFGVVRTRSAAERR